MKKFFIALIGSTVVLIGVAMLVLPGPGLVVIGGGLALLATEFFWARSALRKAKGTMSRARRKLGLRDWLRRARSRSHATVGSPTDRPRNLAVQSFIQNALMRKVTLWPLLVVLLAVLALAGCQATRAGYESAPYTVVRSDGKFELRDYPALTVAETPMAVGIRGGDDGSFMRLFRFIAGGNDAKQKIAMTTPVLMSGGGTNATMAFVLPAKLKTADVPKPSDGPVTVRELAAGRFAVLRYSGARNPAKEAESLAHLKTWMDTEKLKGLSSPVYGYFDPPWTPAIFRRNEVMLRTESGK